MTLYRTNSHRDRERLVPSVQVGVLTMIEPNAGASALEDKVNAAHPITVGLEDNDDGDESD